MSELKLRPPVEKSETQSSPFSAPPEFGGVNPTRKKRTQPLWVVHRATGERNFKKNYYSGIGAVSGICSLALASARTMFPSTPCSEVLRTVASSLIRRYF